MSGTSVSNPEAQPQSTSVTNVSGGNKFDGKGNVNVGGDVVGGNKTESAAGDIIHADVVNIYRFGEHPAETDEKLAQSGLKRQYYEPEMILIPAGPFLMGGRPGSSAQQAEVPYQVDLPVYSIGKYPITNREYAEFIKQVIGQRVPQMAGWIGRKPPADKLDHPVVSVQWIDAVAYCKWLSQQTQRVYRLPSEAEWEKAARGTDGRTYPWGNDWMDHVCNAGAGANGGTMSVKAHAAGASPFGCEDMLGNVEEWTNTLWSTNDMEYTYPYQPDDGREDPDDKQNLVWPLRVHRGGSYRDVPDNLRCSARGNSSPIATAEYRGFRVVHGV